MRSAASGLQHCCGTDACPLGARWLGFRVPALMFQCSRICSSRATGAGRRLVMKRCLALNGFVSQVPLREPQRSWPYTPAQSAAKRKCRILVAKGICSGSPICKILWNKRNSDLDRSQDCLLTIIHSKTLKQLSGVALHSPNR